MLNFQEACVIRIYQKSGYQGTFKKYVRSRFPSFDTLLPLVRPCPFSSPPLLPQGTFVLARTHPLSLNFCTSEIQRQEINEQVELYVSFKKPQCNLYKVDTIGAWQKCLFYGDVLFIVSPSNNQKSSEVNMKSTICYDFLSPDLLEGPKDERIKENAKIFSF